MDLVYSFSSFFRQNFRSGFDRLQPAGQIQRRAYFCMACELQTVFIFFVKKKKKSKRVCDRDSVWPKKYKILLSGPLQEKKCWPPGLDHRL